MNINFDVGFLISLLLYVVIVGFLIFSIYCEWRDINCSKFRGGTCGPGYGTAYVDGKYESGDTREELIEKIRLTAAYETNSITWRRVFVASVFSGFFSPLALQGRIPNGIEFAVAFLISYVFAYTITILMERWISKPAWRQLDVLLDKLKDETK
tara:strand:- start:1164 stop:1625 length:462 start_codon:yes stop_codon:yes gene_type:complete